MAITINIAPQTVDFIFNPIAFKVTGGGTLPLVARIYIEEVYDSGEYTQIPDIYLSPDTDGVAIFYIGRILREYFDVLKTDIFSLAKIEQDNYSLKKYGVGFYEWDGDYLINAEVTDTLYLLYGKLPYQNWPAHTFITTYTAAKDYLNNLGNKVRTWVAAKQYLYWLNHVSGTNNIELRVTIYYTDKSTENQTLDTYTGSDQYNVLVIPAGYTELNLVSYAGSKIIYRYDLGLYLSDDTQVAKTVSFYIYNKPWWGKQFLFRNNYGVLEALIAEGKEASEIKADFETSKKRLQYDYAFDNFEYVQRCKSRKKEFKVSIGPLTRTEAEHLEEMLNDKLYKIGDTKFIPCNILSKSIKPYSEQEDLQTIELKYQYAFEI